MPAIWFKYAVSFGSMQHLADTFGAVDNLRRHRVAQIEQRLLARPGERQNTGLVFTVASGGPVQPRQLQHHFERMIAKFGLPPARFHDLRHSHATQLLMAGERPKVVQERPGHSLISVTLDTYSHVLPSIQREAADKAERLVLGRADT